MLDSGPHRRPVERLVRRSRRVEPLAIEVESDLAGSHPVTEAELDAIEQLLGSDLLELLAD